MAKEPYIFVIFQGGPDPLFPPLDPYMKFDCNVVFYLTGTKVYALTDQLLYIFMDSTKVKNKKTSAFFK